MFHPSAKILRRVALAGMCLALPVLAATLKADLPKSKVTATFRQLNVPVEARFGKFDAQISYDPAKP
jgi:polyisoprenoid-binding protein YceI